LIDLHTHTNQSDGTSSPEQLVHEARAAGVEVLSITDHDTFAGHDAALGAARDLGVELICGIELSTKLNGNSVHLLGYFPRENGMAGFREWVLDMQASRRERNVRLSARLRELGIEVSVEEAEAKGRGMTGRPHFAKVMLEKGYVTNLRQAFDDYLDESAKGYVYRREPQLDEAIAKIRDAGGVASLAHPVRMQGDLERQLPALCGAGLNAIEAYHSDHTEAETEGLLDLARRHALIVTGGSDFHGDVKPEVRLGTGHDGNLNVPRELAESLKQAVAVSGRGA
jgi:3',5'-nucleoside bisphosphate phosphatase